MGGIIPELVVSCGGRGANWADLGSETTSFGGNSALCSIHCVVVQSNLHTIVHPCAQCTPKFWGGSAPC